MYYSECLGMQHLVGNSGKQVIEHLFAAAGVRTIANRCTAICGISKCEVIFMLHMNANLVSPACFKAHFKQREIIKAFKNFILRDGMFTISISQNRHYFPVPGGPSDVSFDGTCI